MNIAKKEVSSGESAMGKFSIVRKGSQKSCKEADIA